MHNQIGSMHLNTITKEPPSYVCMQGVLLLLFSVSLILLFVEEATSIYSFRHNINYKQIKVIYCLYLSGSKCLSSIINS